MFPKREKIRPFPEQQEYWRTKLFENVQPTQISTDHPRLPMQSYIRSRESVRLDRFELEKFCSGKNIEPETTLLAVLNMLLVRYTSQEDICIGCFSNSSYRVDELILNPVVLLTRFAGCNTFLDVLRCVEQTVIEAGYNRDFPFESIVELIGAETDISRAPVFQILFLLPEQEELSEYSHHAVRCDLVFTFRNSSNAPEISCDYHTDLFEAKRIQRLLAHFRNLFDAAITQPEEDFWRFPILTEAEIVQLSEWNNTAEDYPRDLSISQIFEMQVERSPDAIALCSKQGEMTYEELNRRANQLARYLVNEEQVRLETPIGIFMERSLEMIVAMLGILKAGCAYLPLDPDYPLERLHFILKDSEAPIVLTQHRLLERLASCGVKAVRVDDIAEQFYKQDNSNLPISITAKNLCYVMYTSGSTGRPKGVCVEHRGVVRTAKAQNYLNISPEDVFLQIVSCCFDASCTEIWATLLNGARLVLFPHQKPTIAELEREIHRWGLTAVYLTTGLFDRFIESGPGKLGTIRKFMTGGDVISVRNANRAIEIMENGTLFNDYGPTECTELSTCYKLTSPYVSGSIPIGRPLSNTTIHILDRFLQPVPIGVPGEIYIGGDGVARGYLNRPELTKERFLRNPFSSDPEGRLYKSGDMGRWLNDGNLEFLGRIDNQVKVRGFRIELEEIQHVLRQNEAVQDCVVLAVQEREKEKCLVAFVISSNAPSATSLTLRTFLKSKLPDYMVPSYFVFLDSFKLTLNGKVDRTALEAIDFRQPEVASARVAPRTEVETTISQIWCEVLGQPEIGIHDNFFDLGGHSLMAIQIISRISKTFQLELSVRSMFDAPTVATLSALIATNLRG